MTDLTKVPFNSEKLTLNKNNMVELTYDEFDAVTARLSEQEEKATHWVPSISDLESFVKEKGQINSIPFFIWILETSDMINRKENAPIKNYINKFLRKNIELVD